MGHEPARRKTIEPDDERDRRRLANVGALAQSYAPRGLANVLNLSPEGRARARAEWRARPRRQRVWMWIVLAIDVVLMGALFLGVVRRDGELVVVAAGALVAFMLGTVMVTIVAEVRRR